MHRLLLLGCLSPLALPLGGKLALADEPSFTLTIQDHVFNPRETVIPANTKVRLIIRNADKSAEEFDSQQLRREKVIAASSEATLYVGPLPPGAYEFVGEFHPDTAKGRLIAR